MTKNQFDKNFNFLFSEMKKKALTEKERLFNSGALNISDCSKDDFSKVKIILKAALQNAADGVWLYSSGAKEEYENLMNF